jgi:hypothetical protein
VDKELPARTGVAAGLVVAGAGALVAAWVLGDDFVEPEPAPWLTRVATVVVVGLLGGLVYLLRQRPEDRAVRLTTLAAAAVALALTVLAGWGFVDQYSRGFPGEATLLAALGGLAVTVGALLFRPDNGWRRWTTVLPAFLLVPALATPLVLIAPDVRVDATTAAATEAAPVPETVSEVAWSTAVDGPVRDIVAAGAGVVVLLDNGVVAIDGRTGDIRWTRVRHGTETKEIDVSPDGATVLVELHPIAPGPTRREVIDAFTGQLRFTPDPRDPFYRTSWFSPMTNTSYLGSNEDESEFYGYSLTDRSKLWTYRAPTDCWVMTGRSGRYAVAAGMLLPINCQRGDIFEFRYVLLDGTTGKVRWEYSVRKDELSNGAKVLTELAPDRRYLAMDIYEPEMGKAILDTETGKVVSSVSPLNLKAAGIAISNSYDDPQFIDVTGKTLPSTEASRSCLKVKYEITLTSQIACVSPAVDSFDELAESGRIELAIGRFTDTELRSVPITLGGPFEKKEAGYDPALFVAAPGALVVTTQLIPLGDNRVQVMGLR